MPILDNQSADNDRVVVSITNLTKKFPRQDESELLVLDNVSLSVGEGEFVAIVGPSGSGKSTILNIMSGLDTDFGGATKLREENFFGLSYVFQEPRLLPWRNVRENIEFAMQCAKLSRAEWTERCESQLEQVGLSAFADHYPHQLSGGMQQRAAIARAFVSKPTLLLMDEPFSGLDEFTARRLREMLRELCASTGTTVVFVTHNAFEAAFLADRIIVLSRGPARVELEVPIEVDHPRSYDDPKLFALSSVVVNQILKMK